MITEPTKRVFAPGPRPLPVLGWRGQSLRFLADPVGFMHQLYLRYGRVASWMSGNNWWLFAFSPEHNRRVLSDAALFHSVPIAPLETPPDSALARLTYNLLSMNGEIHRQQRRLMLPAFHKKRVEGYRDEMVAITREMLDAWRPGQQLDVSRAMQHVTMRIASRTLFGTDTGADAERVGMLVHEWMGLLESGAVILFPRDVPGVPFRRLMRISDDLERRITDLIAAKRANPDARNDVLSMLIAARDEEGGRLSDSQLIGQTSLVFVAGHETSSNALTWTLFLLAQHPAVAADLLDELDGELRGDAPTVEQLGRLPLLERVVKESMRLLPPATFQMRAATAPFELGPYTAPAGATVTLSPYVTHHMAELYPDPERFAPERWERIAPGTYEYMPFGAGPHMCIGATFAMMEIRLVLAMILQRYRLAIRPGARIDRRVQITMSPRYGMPMTVCRQDRAFERSRAAVRGNIHEMVDLRA